MVIWKYKLLLGLHSVPMPTGASVLSVGAQGEDAVMWVLCDPVATPGERILRTTVTGFEDIDGLEEMTFLGTIQLIAVWSFTSSRRKSCAFPFHQRR